MKRFVLLLALVGSLGSAALAAPLPSSARAAIPKDVQQIINVDYRRLHDSTTAAAMKDKLLPDNLRQFETSLRAAGINPDNELDSLAFATFRTSKQGLRIVGFAQGAFLDTKVTRRLTLKKIKPTKLRGNSIWPMGGGMQMVFLDASTIVFGEPSALRSALDARDGELESVNSNGQITDSMGSVESASVWSVLDKEGTQNLMRSALGDAAKLGDYEVVKKRLLGSRYTMDFNQNIAFDLDVVTSDAMTATMLSSLVKAGVMYRRMTGNTNEKSALESVSVDSDSDRLRLRFRTDERKFQSLLNTDLFAAVTR